MIQDGYQEKLQRCLGALKAAGLKVTKTRRAVLAYLCQSEKPLSPKAILEGVTALGHSATSIDLASVYRILESLKKIKLIHEVHPGNGFLLCFHSQCGADFHLLTHCLKCFKSHEAGIPKELLQPLLWYLGTTLKFTPEGHHFQMNGYCAGCQ